MGEIAINRHRVEGQSPRGLRIWFGVIVGALLLASCAFAGSALAGGPHPDPPPKAPPPPPPAYHPPPPPPPAVVAPPPPPPAYVAPPPPAAPAVHAKVQHKHVKRHVAKHAKPVPKPARPVLAAAGPVAAASAPGTLSPALLIVAFGVVLALLAVGVSFMPASAVPFALGLRLERGRQTILLFGLAIGVACALVGLLTAVAGR